MISMLDTCEAPSGLQKETVGPHSPSAGIITTRLSPDAYSRAEFWRSKIVGNIARDCRVRGQLIETGWRVLEIWECTLRGRNRLPCDEVAGRCVHFLESTEPFATIGWGQTIVEAES